MACLATLLTVTYNAAHLKTMWHSSVYGFFKSDLEIGYENNHKFHLFQCAAKKCKGSGVVWRYLDSKDCAGTSNLRAHTIKCFGLDVVDAVANKTKTGPRDGSIFAAFARPGQQPVMISHHPLTSEETW